MNISENVDLAIENREIMAKLAVQVLNDNKECTELQLQSALLDALAKNHEFYPSGWYDPPPRGVAVLFADSQDSKRTKFPTLRTEPNWPKSIYSRTKESIGVVYFSPVHKHTGIIADCGFTFYQGSNPNIQAHLRNCLETTEEISDYAQVGMKFSTLHEFGRKLLEKRGFDNGWMITFDDPLHGANLGHNIPWTHENPTAAEKTVIDGGDFDELKKIITNEKRFYINSIEDYVIPETIAFSIEPRLGSRADPNLPGGYYYCLVTFRDGEKKVVTNFNTIFDGLHINYMRSRF